MSVSVTIVSGEELFAEFNIHRSVHR